MQYTFFAFSDDSYYMFSDIYVLNLSFFLLILKNKREEALPFYVSALFFR